MNSELIPADLIDHIGHDVVITTYGHPAVNVSLECHDCHVVLADCDVDFYRPDLS